MYKVTVEHVMLKEPIVLEYEFMTCMQERGINDVKKLGTIRVDLKPNGHQRACMKLWSGCELYETFIAHGEEWARIIEEFLD